MTTPGPILVLGATGTTGSRVATRLASLGLPVRPGSRRAAVPFDWDAPHTWPAALEGTSAVYACYHPDLAVPGAGDVIAALTAAAGAAGVERLVLLSGRGEPSAAACEQVAFATGAAEAVAVTVVRCAFFLQNFSEKFMAAMVGSGVLGMPLAGMDPAAAPEPFVDADDIADVVVAALTGQHHAGAVHEVTGPRSLGFDEVVAAISAATGREVRFRAETVPEWVARVGALGVPEAAAHMLAALFREVLDGRNATATGTVAAVLGRPPRDVHSWAREAAAAGAWDAR